MEATVTAKVSKPVNPNRMKVRELAEREGFENIMEFVEELCSDSVVPACCVHGCEVEPDGHCEHGCPSLLLVLGVI